MKQFIMTVLVIALSVVSNACSSGQRVNGWYPVADDPENMIEGEAIVTTQDFAVVTLDSLSLPGVIMIEGKLKADKVQRWAEATESRIGKRIGFLFNDSVVMAPTVNCRIESGSFSIVTDNPELVKEIYSTIKAEL